MKGRGRAAEVRRAQAEAAYADLVPVAAGLRAGGLWLRVIDGRLNAECHTTRWGAAWNPVQVRRLLGHAGRAEVDRTRDASVEADRLATGD